MSPNGGPANQNDGVNPSTAMGQGVTAIKDRLRPYPSKNKLHSRLPPAQY